MEGGKKGIQNDMEIKLTNSGYHCKLTLASPRKEPTTSSIVWNKYIPCVKLKKMVLSDQPLSWLVQSSEINNPNPYNVAYDIWIGIRCSAPLTLKTQLYSYYHYHVFCTLCIVTIWVVCPLPRSRPTQNPVPNFTGHYASNQEQEASEGGK